mgnify:CR=1 FL=1
MSLPECWSLHRYSASAAEPSGIATLGTKGRVKFGRTWLELRKLWYVWGGQGSMAISWPEEIRREVEGSIICSLSLTTTFWFCWDRNNGKVAKLCCFCWRRSPSLTITCWFCSWWERNNGKLKLCCWYSIDLPSLIITCSCFCNFWWERNNGGKL